MRLRLFAAAIICIIAITAFSHVPVAAQTASPTPNANCKATDLVKSLASIKPANDSQKDMDALLKLDDQIKDQNAACNGLYFKGTGQKSIGPIDIPSGSYLVHLVTSGYFIAHLKLVSGSCKTSDFNETSMYNVSSGQATDGADITIDSDGCRALILTSNVDGAWKLTFSILQ